jgi:hypothetical protein
MTTYNLVSRAEWDARPPTSTTLLQWSKVQNFIVHYSGASRTQSVRSIQNYCMDNKGHSDIDYNYLVRDNDLYVGRGVNVGSHTLDNNSTSVGICVIGLDGDATEADFRVIRQVYDELTVKLGRQLNAIGHNQAPTLPPGYTDCPGSEIQAWINAGMPVNSGMVDMFLLRDDATGAIYISTGLNTRHMPPETLKTTIEPLQALGVPMLHYKSLTEVTAAGGPLVKEIDVDAPTVAKITFPPGTVTLE